LGRWRSPYTVSSIENSNSRAVSALAANWPLDIELVSQRRPGEHGPGRGRIGGTGGLTLATSAIWFRLGSDPSYLLDFLPAQIVGGAGIGVTFLRLVGSCH